MKSAGSSSTVSRKLAVKRKMREHRRELLKEMDKLVSRAHRTSQPVKTSGNRACGTSGRSLHNILANVMAFTKSAGCTCLV